MGRSLSWNISSDTQAASEVQAKIVDMCSEHLDGRLSPGEIERFCFGVRLALEEAFVNHIKHGNEFDVLKRVCIICSLTRKGIEIESKDEGEGFTPEEVPDPTEDENLERPCGRGLTLMRHFMTTVEFPTKFQKQDVLLGTCVRMTKDFPQREEDGSAHLAASSSI